MSYIPRRSRSAIALANLGLTQEEVARRVGVSQPSVCAYLAGTKRPNPSIRARIAEEWPQVTVGGWDVIPGDDSPPKPAPLPPLVTFRPLPTRPVPEPASTQPVTIASVIGGPIGQALELDALTATQIGELRAEFDRPHDDRTIPRAELTKMLARLAGVTERVARLTGDHDLSRRVLELPRWKAMRATIEAALEPYPDAARAVGEALLALHASRTNTLDG